MALPGDPSLESSSLGYRVDHRGHSVVIGIGAHARPQTLQSLKHVDVMLLRQPEALLASKTFADVNPRLAVLSWRGASDPRRAVRQHYAGPLELAEDMMTIDVNEQIEIRRQTR
jgi:hypothetical protein